jgi:hypothetical protein
MAVNTRLIQLIHSAIGSLAILWVLAPAASADCAKDVRGEVYCGGGRCIADRKGTVWCSRFYKGDAESTQDGRAVCGKGQCAKDLRGRVFCSSVVGGAVLIDSWGRVRCYRRCERATTEQCEHTPADSSG